MRNVENRIFAYDQIKAEDVGFQNGNVEIMCIISKLHVVEDSSPTSRLWSFVFER